MLSNVSYEKYVHKESSFLITLTHQIHTPTKFTCFTHFSQLNISCVLSCRGFCLKSKSKFLPCAICTKKIEENKNNILNTFTFAKCSIWKKKYCSTNERHKANDENAEKEKKTLYVSTVTQQRGRKRERERDAKEALLTHFILDTRLLLLPAKVKMTLFSLQIYLAQQSIGPYNIYTYILLFKFCTQIQNFRVCVCVQCIHAFSWLCVCVWVCVVYGVSLFWIVIVPYDEANDISYIKKTYENRIIIIMVSQEYYYYYLCIYARCVATRYQCTFFTMRVCVYVCECVYACGIPVFVLNCTAYIHLYIHTYIRATSCGNAW